MLEEHKHHFTSTTFFQSQNRQTYRRKPQLLFGTETCDNAFLIPEHASSQWEIVDLIHLKTFKAQDPAVGVMIYYSAPSCNDQYVCGSECSASPPSDSHTRVSPVFWSKPLSSVNTTALTIALSLHSAFVNMCQTVIDEYDKMGWTYKPSSYDISYDDIGTCVWTLYLTRELIIKHFHYL